MKKKGRLCSVILAAAMVLTAIPTYPQAVEAAATEDTEYSMDIDTTDEGAEISQDLFGLFFEDINSAADGGLNPEMVKNNSFENYFNVVSINETSKGNQYSWKLHWTSTSDNHFTVISDADTSLNENNTNYAEIVGNMQLSNGGYAPISTPNVASMPIVKDEKFDFSIWTRADESYSGTLTVQVVTEDGEALTEAQTIPLVNNGTWQKTEKIVFTGLATEKGRINLTFSGAKQDDIMDIDFVSLSPEDTYGYGNKNYAGGMGLRKDLVEKLLALNPSFIRFPGGCITEGNSGRDSYYNWENSIGELEERKQVCNLWSSDDGSDSTTYGYMQSYGFGYHEILTLCEDMGAEPYPILSAGVFCQFANGDNTPAATGEELDGFAQHATNLIDYCWGSTLSSNATQREWAQKRVNNGHEQQFNLNYIGIGNENWGDKYLNNFQYIKNYIEKYVQENYPGRTITIISSSGASSSGSSYEYGWSWLNNNAAGETMVDEHYYQTKNYMLTNDDRYNYYSRVEDGGSDVFVGEYATHLDNNRNNNLESAICDAAYMTGLERNGDIVRSASYAPLLEKIGSTNWSQNMIHFDEYDSFATPNYYTQQMYANNYGTTIVNTLLSKQGENYDKNTGSPVLATWATGGYITHIKVTREDGKVLLEDDFTKNGDNTAGMKWELMDGSTGSFTIGDGKLTLTQGSGKNAVWLPDAADDPEWVNYTVEATVVKTSGAEGFLVGAGATSSDTYYWYNIGGWSNTKTMMEHYVNGSSSILGNSYGKTFTAVEENQEMNVTFVYGVDGEMKAGYTTDTVDYSDDFSSYLMPYQNDIYQVCSKDDQYIYLKLVNHDSYDKEITLNYKQDLYSDDAEIICLSGDGSEENSIGNEIVSPVTTYAKVSDSKLTYTVPAMSFSVIKVQYSDGQGADQVQTKPEKVTGVKTAASTKSVKITWNKVSDADYYEIYRQDKGTGKFTKIATVKDKTSYKDSKNSTATAYAYKVRAVKSNLPGSFSAVAKTITKPGITTITSLKKKSGKVELKFKKVSGASAYVIYKYNTKKKTYEIAYKVEGKKLYSYNTAKKKYTKIGTVKVSTKTYTAILKKATKGKYLIKVTTTKKGYPGATGGASKAKTLK